MSYQTAPRRPVLLIIMDGIGHNPSKVNNAFYSARTPNLDSLFSSSAMTVLEASGLAVGLPVGQMGNSEVGHTTIGAGAIIRQDLVRIDEEVESGAFYQNAAFNAAFERAKANNRPVHLLGLVSDGGIHSHIRHLTALIRLAADKGVRPVVHAITDGRDTAPNSSLGYCQQLEEELKRAQGAIASICGRFYALDRDNRWNRVEKAFRLLTSGEGIQATTIEEGIEQSWKDEVTDEFILPIALEAFEPIENDDEVIFFNFRNDRPRELTSSLLAPGFAHFERGTFKGANITTMTQYDVRFGNAVAFEKDTVSTPLARVISEADLKQFHVAETEKYPHVTFFFNGGEEQAFVGEERVLIPSPKVDTYNQQPEMSAKAITEATVKAMHKNEYGFVVVNYANGDMVGHTGDMQAAVNAVETVDSCVGALINTAKETGYSIIVTADHGNCDVMLDAISGLPHTQHTTFPVACSIVDPDARQLANGCGLSSIAPTVLTLMGLPVPDSMTGLPLVLA